MEAGLIIGNQIIIMFIILIIGAFCYLKGIITKDGTKQLSSFALNIINPVLIFMSYQSKYDKTLVHGLLWSFLLSAISYAVTILLTYVLIRKKTPDLAVERVSSIYSNCAFMCIPLINGIYGSEGVLYLTAYLTFFNVLIWTHGLMTMKGERDFSSLTVSYSRCGRSYLLSYKYQTAESSCNSFAVHSRYEHTYRHGDSRCNSRTDQRFESPSKPPYLLRFTVQAHNTPCGRLLCSVDT